MVALADEVVEVSDKGDVLSIGNRRNASGKSGLVEDSRPDAVARPATR
jgi:hypothetical protein